MIKDCDNCIHSGRPSYEWPCTVCETAYGSAPSKWEGMVSTTADMVEVVRCKDCFANGCCSVQIDLDMGDEGYCPKGRKEN